MSGESYRQGWLARRLTRRRFLRGAAGGALGLAGTAVLACRQEAPQPEEAPQPAGLIDFDANLRVGIGQDVGSMDPMSVAGAGGGGWPNWGGVHYQTPFTVDPQTSEVVGLVADWSWVDNNTAMLLRLKPGWKFHNGTTVTAEDLKFSLDRAVQRNTPSGYQSGVRGQLAAAGEATVIDQNTLRVELLRRDATLPFKMAGSLRIMSKAWVAQVGEDEVTRRAMGTGPFRFLSRIPDTEIRSERFDDYPIGRDARYGPRLPFVKTLVQRVMPEVQARVAALEAGELEVAWNVTVDVAKSFEGRRGYSVFYLQNDQPIVLTIDTFWDRDPATGAPNPWKDIRVRRAANMAIDMDTIIRTLLFGKEPYSYGFSRFTVGLPKEELERMRYRYDPAQARRLLSEAGYADGFDTVIMAPVGRWPNNEQVVQAIANYLRQVGIRASVQLVQYQQFITQLGERPFRGLIFTGIAGGVDPSVPARFQVHSKAPYVHYFDPQLSPQLDALIEQIEGEFDPARRNRLVADLVKKVYENANFVFLYEPTYAGIARGNVSYDVYFPTVFYPEYWNIKVLKS
jgi:peptide/nickel transport system substrate-binding protein